MLGQKNPPPGPYIGRDHFRVDLWQKIDDCCPEYI